MIDYYVELNIDSSLGINEINEELSKLDSTWKRRELNNPEKATKMLALIIDAREVFKSVQTKSKYDRELAESKQPSESDNPNWQRKNDIQKWKDDANAYYNSGEYDLAKIAVDRALALVTDSLDDGLYALAAAIYMEVREYNAALNFINNAIVTNSQNGLHYLMKASIYGCNAAIATQYHDPYKVSQHYGEVRRLLQAGLDIANSNGDIYAKSCLLGSLAFSLYFEQNPDKRQAEELAREALAIDENQSNAQKVMDAVKEQRKAEEQAAWERQQRKKAAENARKEGIYNEAKELAESKEIFELEKAISKFKSIPGYKDSARQIDDLVTKIQKKIETRKKGFKLLLLSIPVFVVAIVIGMFVYNIQYQKCGKNLKWNYDAGTKTLTISGAGSMYDHFSGVGTRPWDSLYKEIDTVIIEGGCTHISNYAFYDFTQLEKVSIPDSVISIGEGAFSYSDLHSVNIPPFVVEIGGWAFLGCHNLEAVFIPDGVKSIGDFAFSGIYDLGDITIPQSVTSIGIEAFNDCKRDSIIHYSGTKEQWLSIASGLDFSGIIECSDGNLRYPY